MNWEAISAVAEIIGATAVIVTLGYLAVQIKQNTQMNASAIRQSFYDYTARQMLHGTDTENFNELFDKTMMTDNELSTSERIQMLRFFQALFVGYQGAFFQYRHNALNEDDWRTCRSLLRSFWLAPGKEISRIWDQLQAGGFLDEDFVTEVEEMREDVRNYEQRLNQEGLEFGHD